ncbi:zinc finger protein 423-like isoform X1 [Mercenaria mercenaria]|uniref:zinc finger protein 423-like isoform X1 n=1 Tax=Mercenaria mercenaria TaxID=6596 RepID=UPI00234F99B8|nr:zinc finger protein 423-like isoform X1 [Mercenaria mercenaria]
MESYLMMIYVTLEQESALKTFFLDQGWAFCKPDLSYTTDKLGPAAGTFPNIVRDDEFINNPSLKSLNEQSSKRKLQPPYASPSKFKRSKMTKSSEKVLDELGDNFEKQDDATHETDGADKERVVRKMPTPITVQDIDGNSKAIKVEVTDDDDKYDPAGSTADDISAMNDDYNGDTDLEDSYGPEGGMLDDSQMSRSSHLDASLNTDEDDSQASGSKQKHDMMINWSADTPELYSCDRSFMLKQGLNWTCGYKPAIKCTFCHKTFTSLSARKRHERTVHAMERNFKCDHCEERFAYKWLMEAHAAKKHGIGKLFTCACGQTFNRQSNLTQHANICKAVQGPGNETVCKVCTKRFKCKKYLDVHMKFQHDITTLPSVCNICGESFTRPWSLTRHLKRRHAIIDVSTKDIELGLTANMSNKEAESDSDADMLSKETKSDSNTERSSKEKKSGSNADLSNKESAPGMSKGINPDSDEEVSSEKEKSETFSDVSNTETKPDSHLCVK